MLVLDTHHLSLLDRADNELGERVRRRLNEARPRATVTTIVNYEEQTRGWLAFAAKAKTVAQLVDAYHRLQNNLELYRSIPILGFDEAAAVRYQELKKAKIRVGTVDLRIAAIALCHDATVLSRNLRDFERVPGLHVEDWTSAAL